MLKVNLAGHTGTTTADASGRWTLLLPALSAGGPFALTIRGKKEVAVKDVMIGEVWLASGQSNMTFGLGGADSAETEVPRADYPQIRLFTVPQKIALSPQDTHWPLIGRSAHPIARRNFPRSGTFSRVMSIRVWEFPSASWKAPGLEPRFSNGSLPKLCAPIPP